MKKLVFLFFTVFFIVFTDQLSKIQVEKNLLIRHNSTNLLDYQGKRIPVVRSEPITFHLSYVRNQGAAWGLGAKINDKYRDPFFYTMMSISMLFILFYIRMTPPQHWHVRILLMMVMGGAIGNLVDRIRLKYVIDFLEFNFFGWYFPSFNVADSAITIAVFSLMIIYIREDRKQQHLTRKVSNETNPI